MRFFHYLLPLLLCVTFPVFADELLIEPDMGRAPILEAIDHTNQSIKLVMYGLTDKQILNALIDLHRRGRTVQVILEKSPYKTENENKPAFEKLSAENIPWHNSISPYQLIHQKTLLLDNEKVIVMTFNFTHSSFKNQRNFAVVIDDPAEVHAINAIFTADWNNKTPLIEDNRLIVSPDNSRDRIQQIIHAATKSIDVYAQNVSDYQTIGAIAKGARKGVQVRLLTSNKLKEKAENYLHKAGVEIHYSKKYVIHAKVIILDQQQAIVGSINLTQASINNNRELSVLVSDPVMVNQLVTTFNSDWKDGLRLHIIRATN